MPEIVEPGETGYLVERDASFATWEVRFRKVVCDFDRLSQCSRELFLTHFDARLGPSYLRPMLDAVGSPDLRSPTTSPVCV